jgi:hypothetical protein
VTSDSGGFPPDQPVLVARRHDYRVRRAYPPSSKRTSDGSDELTTRPVYGRFGTGGLISWGALLRDGNVGRYVHAATRPSARTIANRRKMLIS